MWKQLIFDGNSGRLVWGDVELHAGQCLDVGVFDYDDEDALILPARLEADGAGGWYLVGVPGVSPIGLFARM